MKKLSLKKEVIANLKKEEMGKLKGGDNFFTSRFLCLSIDDWDCKTSYSCHTIICIPCDTSTPV